MIVSYLIIVLSLTFFFFLFLSDTINTQHDIGIETLYAKLLMSPRREYKTRQSLQRQQVLDPITSSDLNPLELLESIYL